MQVDLSSPAAQVALEYAALGRARDEVRRLVADDSTITGAEVLEVIEAKFQQALEAADRQSKGE